MGFVLTGKEDALRVLASMLAAVAMSGCAATVVSSTPRQVVIDAGRPPRPSGQVLALANQECARYGRYAQMVGRPIYGETSEYVFHCVQ